jgi:hypothetical protein
MAQIRMAAMFGSAADKMEAQVARLFQDRVVGFQKIIDSASGERLSEIDVELDNAIIEVTGGVGRGKLDQLSRLMSPAINPLGKQVIIYGPNITPGRVQNLTDAGAKVAQSLFDLQVLLDPEHFM